MAEIYDAQGMHEKAQKAFDQLKKHQAQDDIFFQSLMMKELVAQHEMNSYKQTMLGLYKEKYFLIRLTFIFIFIIIVLVLVSMGVYKLMRQQKHIREKEHELALARQQEDTLKIKNAELELTAKEAEQKTLEAKLESQDQELVYQSLKQIYFSQLTATIKEKFGPFQRKLNRKKDQEQFEKTLDEVCREASHNPLAEFEQIFLQMHHGFYEKLLEISPQLSRSELQLCALLRMNLPSKEIASLLFLSLSTIDQKRHQIRKKLGLESNQSLNNFLINL
jgi:AraC family transcriptional regulator, chitin signaling transcriptional activator